MRSIVRTVRVCHECLNALVDRGAIASPVAESISLGHACEVHPTRTHVQAQHFVSVAPSTLQQWSEEMREVVASETVSDGEALVVAGLAISLLAGNVGASETEMATAVGTARRVLAIAKRGA